MRDEELIRKWKDILIKSEDFHHLIKELDDPKFRDFVLLHTTSLQTYLINAKKVVDEIIANYLQDVTNISQNDLKEKFAKEYEPYIDAIYKSLKS